ncbi:MAG: DUF1257 domain-containing protein [Phycisphaeraceae bacterium]
MSAVCVLTPVVIASWPAIATAVAGVAASMGFSMASANYTLKRDDTADARTSVETEIAQSEVTDQVASNQPIRIQRGGVTIEFARDSRGRCTVCTSGEGHSKAELRRIGEEVAGRLVQQFAYHKLMTELKQRNYDIIETQVSQDDTIHVRVRAHGSPA